MAGNNDFLQPLSGDMPKIISETPSFGGLKNPGFPSEFGEYWAIAKFRGRPSWREGVGNIFFCDPSQAICPKICMKLNIKKGRHGNGSVVEGGGWK